MSYSKFFYVDRALQNFDFPDSDNVRIANLLVTFAAFVAKKNSLSLSLTVSDVLSGEDVPYNVKKIVAEEGNEWGKSSLESFEKVSIEDIKSFIAEKICEWNEQAGVREMFLSFPESLNYLCAHILDIQKEDSIVDLGAGMATFLIYAAKNYPHKKLVGIEIDEKGCLFASLLSYIEDTAPEIICADVLDIDEANKFDKIISFPTFNSKETVPFIKKVVNLLSKDGRAVLYLSRNFLNSSDIENETIRKQLLENGFIESVIELAAGVLYPLTGVQTALIVLCHNNQNVHFVNATSVSENTRRGKSVLTEDGANKILEMMHEKSDNSKSVNIEQIKAQNFILSPSSYLLEEKITLNGIELYAKLCDLVETKIMRGAQIKASELEELESNSDTGIFYAFAKDIQDNRLAAELKALKEIDKKLETLVLKEGDILLVMALTESLKLACIENLEGRKIIPASNMYIIRPNKAKLEPLYLKMLLETERSLQIFTAFSSGTVLRSISADFLNKLQIPLPALELQKKLAEKYAEIEEQRKQLKKQLKELAEQKTKILDELEGFSP